MVMIPMIHRSADFTLGRKTMVTSSGYGDDSDEEYDNDDKPVVRPDSTLLPAHTHSFVISAVVVTLVISTGSSWWAE